MKPLSKKKSRGQLQVVTYQGTSWLIPTQDGVAIAVIVVYHATRTRIMGLHHGLLKIQLASVEAYPRANAVLQTFLAERLGIHKAQIMLTSGGTNDRKRLAISGISYQNALLTLSPSPA